MSTENQNSMKLEMSVKMVSAYVKNNPVSSRQLPEFINEVVNVVNNLPNKTSTNSSENQKPAVSIKKSLQHSHIVCLEDGLQFKSLKRHLKSRYNLTPEEYRQKWGLPHDYPMVAPVYAEYRSNLAKKTGLGSKGGRKKKT